MGTAARNMECPIHFRILRPDELTSRNGPRIKGAENNNTPKPKNTDRLTNQSSVQNPFRARRSSGDEAIELRMVSRLSTEHRHVNL